MPLCSDVLLCSNLCQHNPPRPTTSTSHQHVRLKVIFSPKKCSEAVSEGLKIQNVPHLAGALSFPRPTFPITCVRLYSLAEPRPLYSAAPSPLPRRRCSARLRTGLCWLSVCTGLYLRDCSPAIADSAQ